jgi:hypothetical protein
MKGSTAFIGSENELDTATTKLVTGAQAAAKAYQDMSAALANNAKDAAGNVVSANDVANAYDNWQKKLAALNALNPVFAESIGGVTKAFNEEQAKISALQQTVLQLMNAQDGSIGQAEKLAAAQNDLSKALDGVVKAAQAQVIPIQGTGEGYIYMGTQAEALVQKQRDLTLSVQQAAAVVKDLNDQADSSPDHTRAVIQALTDWQTAIKNTGGDLNQLQTIVINGVLFSGKLPDIIKQASDQLKQFGGSVVSVSDELNLFGLYIGDISDTMKSNITVIKGSDDALKQYHGTIVDGQPIIKGYVDDTTKAIGYNKQFTGSVNDAGAAIGNTLTPNLNSASSSLSTLSLDAEQAQKSMQGLGSAAKTTGDEIDQAISAMDNWDSHLGSADATGLGAWTLAATLNGQTTFAGSGSAVNSQGQQVSALTELQAANQAAGVALAASLGLTTTATTAQTKATDTLTTSTTATTTSTSGLSASIRDLNSATSSTTTTVASTSDSLGSLGDTITSNTLPAVNFAAMSGTDLANSINTLNHELGTAGVVVDGAGLSAVDYATKLQNTVDGMNAAAKASSSLASSSGSAATDISTAAAVIKAAGSSLMQGAPGPSSTSQPGGFSSTPTGTLQIGQPPPMSNDGNNGQILIGYNSRNQPVYGWADMTSQEVQAAIAQSIPPSGSTVSSVNFDPNQAFPTAISGNQSTTSTYASQSNASPIQININYPQFNSQQQSNKVMSDMIANLRTVAGQKL